MYKNSSNHNGIKNIKNNFNYINFIALRDSKGHIANVILMRKTIHMRTNQLFSILSKVIFYTYLILTAGTQTLDSSVSTQPLYRLFQ